MRVRCGSGFLLLLLLLVMLGGCSRDRTLCDYADGLVKDARLTEAANAYAAAARAEEGDCAEEGADEVADKRKVTTKEVAAARAALSAGDRAAARASFQAALRIDRGDEAAVQGMNLLGQAPSAAAVPTVVVHEVPVRPSPDSVTLLAFVVGTVAMLACAAHWLLWRRRAADLDAGLAAVRRNLEHHETGAGRESRRIDEIVDEVVTLKADITAEAEKTATLKAQGDELREVIDRSRRTTLRLFRSALPYGDPGVTHEKYLPSTREQ